MRCCLLMNEGWECEVPVCLGKDCRGKQGELPVLLRVRTWRACQGETSSAWVEVNVQAVEIILYCKDGIVVRFTRSRMSDVFERA
jgi:hypothetical protein